MKYNVYDFDKTIYKGDSTVDFYFFCVKKYPAILLELPVVIIYWVLYLFKITSITALKEKFFRFLRHLDSIEELLTEFWDTNQEKIRDFYKKAHKENDIVISASPEFLLRPICRRLNINYLIASNVNMHTGLYSGINCRGEEKLARFREKFTAASIEEFYSDSLSDEPLAKIAERAYIVRKNDIIPWSDYRPGILEKLKFNYFSRDFLLFVFCGGMGTLTNFLLSLVISIKVNQTLSYVCGYAISLLVTYALNASLIFKTKYNFHSYIKFVMSYIPNFLILFTFVAVFLNVLHWNKIVVYALAALFGLPVTYLLVQIFAFGKKETLS